MDYRCITFERREAVGLVTLNRPERANAMNRTMLAELNAACDAAEADETLRALVVTGAGGVFSSGFDLKEQAAAPPEGVAQWRDVLRDGLRHGDALLASLEADGGGGARPGARGRLRARARLRRDRGSRGRPFRRAGAALRRRHRRHAVALAHRAQAREGDPADRRRRDRRPTRLREIGLVNRVAPVGEEVEAALSLARRMAAVEPALLKRTKATINRMYRMVGFDEALDMALDQDLLIEAEGTATKREFLEITRTQGLRAAIEWRDAKRRARQDGGTPWPICPLPTHRRRRSPD